MAGPPGYDRPRPGFDLVLSGTVTDRDGFALTGVLVQLFVEGIASAAAFAAVAGLPLSGIIAFPFMIATSQQQAQRKAKGNGAQEPASCKHRPTPCSVGIRKCLQPRQNILPASHYFVMDGESWNKRAAYRRFLARPS
jgi:hypothetical protein